MKQIKKIVLRDATKLTNSQMKEIRGGYEPEKEYLTGCFVMCETGGHPLEQFCSGNSSSYCDIISGANGAYLGVGCFMDNYIEHHLIPGTDKYCPQVVPSVEPLE